jgi:outer membrane protein
VKRTILFSLILAALVGTSVWVGSALGQQNAAKAPATELPHKIGLIDMAQVFKDYKKFEALRNDLKEELETTEAKGKELADKIQAVQNELKSGVFKDGSQDFIARETQLTKLTSDFQTFRAVSQKEFLRKESKIYGTVYKEVEDAIQKYCKAYKYTLILRFSREELNSDDPQKLIAGLQRQVVHFRSEDDLTDSVVDFLNNQYAKSGGTPRAVTPAGGTSSGATKGAVKPAAGAASKTSGK